MNKQVEIENYKEYVTRRLGEIGEAINEFTEGNFDKELPLEDKNDELDLISMGLNMMKAEILRVEDSYKHELKKTKQLAAETKERLELIEKQQEVIRQLSTPVIEIWDDVLVLPVIGIVDSMRATEMMESLLKEVAEKGTRSVIIDITGVDTVDTKTAESFFKMVKASKLMGAQTIMTGISPEIAQTLTQLGIDFSGIITCQNLKEGLKRVLELTEKKM